MFGTNIIFILTFIFIECAFTENMGDEIALHEYFSNRYNPQVRPNRNRSEPTGVSVELCLISILSLDEKRNILETSVYFQVQWKDELLSWNTSEYGNLKDSLVSISNIWVPDLVVKNSVNLELLHSSDYGVPISYEGEILWLPRVGTKTTCQVDMTYYPFDEQECSIKMTPWNSIAAKVRLVSQGKKEIDLTYYGDNGEWDIIETTEHTYLDHYSFRGKNLTYTCISWTLKLRRKPGFYIMNVMAPIALLALLNAICFFLPCESGEKISLSISIFLTFTVMLTLISDSLPKTSESIPLLSIYLISQLCLSGIIIVSQVIALRSFHCSKNLHTSKNYFSLCKTNLMNSFD